MVLLSVACGLAFQANQHPWQLILGWPAVAFLQALEKVQAGDHVGRILVQIPVLALAVFNLFAYTIWPGKRTMFVGILTTLALILVGLFLGFAAHTLSDFDFM